jgi:hypothetical protein
MNLESLIQRLKHKNAGSGSEESEKLLLRCLLLKSKADNSKVALDLEISEDGVLSLVRKHNLELEGYQYLSNQVEEFREQKSYVPLWPDEFDFFMKDGKLNEIGWRAIHFAGIEIWEKGPTYTSMTSRIIIDYGSDTSHLLLFELYGPANEKIREIVRIFKSQNKHPSIEMLETRRRLALVIAECYLSGATNDEQVLSIFKNYRKEDPLGENVTKAVARLREYLSGSVIQPNDFNRALGLIRQHMLNPNQLVFLHEMYSLIYRSPRQKSFYDFMRECVCDMNLKEVLLSIR